MSKKNKFMKSQEMVIANSPSTDNDIPVKIQWTTLSLRIPKSFVKIIDNQKSTGTSRNAWILESIQKKLERDKE